MKSLIILTSLLLFLGCSNLKVDTKNRNIRDKQIKEYLDELAKSKKYVGIQYLVYNKDGILFNYSAGVKDLKSKEKLKDDNTFNAYSSTKVVTGISILQLQEKGKLNINDNVSKYLDIPFKGITIKQLLTHSAGIPDPFLGNGFIHFKEEHQKFDRNQLLKDELKENNKFSYKPGKKIKYSNLGYVFLGYIIEEVSGMKYEDYVIKNIFEPLHLDQSKIHFNDQSYSDSAKPYFSKYSIIYTIISKLYKGFKYETIENYKHPTKYWYFNYPSIGGIVTNTTEYSKIFSDLLKTNSMLLNKESKKVLFTKQASYKNLPYDYAISWEIHKNKNSIYFEHYGGGLGYAAAVRLYKEKGIGSILLLNTTSFSKLKINNELDKMFFDH